MQFDRLKRREFVKLLGGAAVVWPLAGRAQQPTMPVIGFVSGGSPDTFDYLVSAFREGLGEIGYVRAAMSRSSFVGRRGTTIACLRCSPI